jgi:maleate isomerase
MGPAAPDPLRLGLVVPGDCHVDDELWRLAYPEAIPYVTRTLGASDERMGADAISEVTGLAEGPEIGAAATRLRDVSPVAAAYVDTSISFVRGSGGDTEIAGRIEGLLGCPAIVTSTAVVAACRALGVRRLAALSPYTDDLNGRMASYLAEHDLELVAVHPLRRTYPGGTTSRELGRTEPHELLADAEPVQADGVEALFLPCTAVRTLGAVALLESALGMPVVTAVQATMWAVLRLAGLGVGRPGAGRLFALESLPPPGPGGAETRGGVG